MLNDLLTAVQSVKNLHPGYDVSGHPTTYSQKFLDWAKAHGHLGYNNDRPPSTPDASRQALLADRQARADAERAAARRTTPATTPTGGLGPVDPAQILSGVDQNLGPQGQLSWLQQNLPPAVAGQGTNNWYQNPQVASWLQNLVGQGFAGGGEVPRTTGRASGDEPSDKAALVPIVPSVSSWEPDYLRAMERMHENRKRAQGIK